MPLSFTDRPFLEAIYRDDTPFQVYKKSTQCGLTERTFCYVMSKLKQSWGVLYVWPGLSSRTNFSKRLDRQISFIRHYQDGQAAAPIKSDSATLKYFWKGQLKLVGANVVADLKEFPADMVVVEERDQCDDHNLGEAFHRLDNSPHKYKIIIGNPTVENEGICAAYDLSDQKHWFVKCEHCNEWQQLDWFFNITREISPKVWQLLDWEWIPESNHDVKVYCLKCNKELNRFAKGEWVAAYPHRSKEISGYQISQLFSSLVSIREMWEHYERGKRNDTEAQLFFNNRLGLAFVGGTAKLSHALLDACCGDYQIPMNAKDATAGIDVGARICHVTITDYPVRGQRRLVYAGIVPLELDALCGVLALYGVGMACIDAEPETHFARQFRDRYGKSRVWLIDYFSNPNPHEMKCNEDERIITLDRTSSLDAMVAEINLSADQGKAGQQRCFLLPANAKSLCEGDYYKQMCASTRFFDKDLGDRGAFVWKKGIDHFFHSANYNKIAADLRPGPMKIMVATDREFAADGRY